MDKTLERILNLITENSISEKKFLMDNNFSLSTMSDWKSGRMKSYEKHISKIAEYFNVSTDYLLGLSPVKTDMTKWKNYRPAETEFIDIPILGSVSAGVGCLADNHIIGYEPWSASSIKYGHDYIVLEVSGDSMYPMLIEGDLILVQCQNTVDSGSIAVLTVNGDEGVIKKVKYGKTWIELHSTNPMYPVRRFEGEDVQEINVMGLVVESKRKFI